MSLSDVALLLASVMERFGARRSWDESEFSDHLGLRGKLLDVLTVLAEQGWPLRLEGGVWSIPEGWRSASVQFSPLELAELLRLLVRSPRSKARDRLLAKLTRRMRQDPWVAPLGIDPRDEHRLALERAARSQTVVEILYFSRETYVAESRLVSVQDSPLPDRTACWGVTHPYNTAVRVLLDCVLDVRERPDRSYLLQAQSPSAPEPIPKVRVAFDVPQAKARQLLAGLPPGLSLQHVGKAIRVEGAVEALTPVALLVLALGAGVVIETPELRGLVDALARIAIGELGLHS